jgi:hypothetical protein
MELTLAMPRQPTTAPILFVSIILGLLLSPLRRRALESWMPMHATGAQQQSNPDSHGSTWGPAGDVELGQR